MDKTELLKQYKNLKDEGTITEEEFAKFKESIVYDDAPATEEPRQSKDNGKSNRRKILIAVTIIVGLIIVGVVARIVLVSSKSNQVDKMPLPLEMSNVEVYQYIQENGYDATDYGNGAVSGDLCWFGLDKMFRVYSCSSYEDYRATYMEYRTVYIEAEDADKVLSILKEWYGEEAKGYYDTTYIWQVDDMVIEYRWYKGGKAEVTYYSIPTYEAKYDVTL